MSRAEAVPRPRPRVHAAGANFFCPGMAPGPLRAARAPLGMPARVPCACGRRYLAPGRVRVWARGLGPALELTAGSGENQAGPGEAVLAVGSSAVE